MEYISSPFWFSLPPSQNPPKDSTVDNLCQLMEAVCNMKPVYSCWESMTLLTAKAVCWEQRSLWAYQGEVRVDMGLE